MSKETKSKTEILFDLNDVMEPTEVENFVSAAEERGKSSTELFIDLTLKKKEVA